jgi:hypothetical protein
VLCARDAQCRGRVRRSKSRWGATRPLWLATLPSGELTRPCPSQGPQPRAFGFSALTAAVKLFSLRSAVCVSSVALQSSSATADQGRRGRPRVGANVPATWPPGSRCGAVPNVTRSVYTSGWRRRYCIEGKATGQAYEAALVAAAASATRHAVRRHCCAVVSVITNPCVRRGPHVWRCHGGIAVQRDAPSPDRDGVQLARQRVRRRPGGVRAADPAVRRCAGGAGGGVRPQEGCRLRQERPGQRGQAPGRQDLRRPAGVLGQHHPAATRHSGASRRCRQPCHDPVAVSRRQRTLPRRRCPRHAQRGPLCHARRSGVAWRLLGCAFSWLLLGQGLQPYALSPPPFKTLTPSPPLPRSGRRGRAP